MVSHGAPTPVSWVVLDFHPIPPLLHRLCGFLYYNDVLAQKTWSTITWVSHEFQRITFRMISYDAISNSNQVTLITWLQYVPFCELIHGWYEMSLFLVQKHQHSVCLWFANMYILSGDRVVFFWAHEKFYFLEIRGSHRTAKLQTKDDLLTYDALLWNYLTVYNRVKISLTIHIYSNKMQHSH